MDLVDDLGDIEFCREGFTGAPQSLYLFLDPAFCRQRLFQVQAPDIELLAFLVPSVDEEEVQVPHP